MVKVINEEKSALFPILAVSVFSQIISTILHISAGQKKLSIFLSFTATLFTRCSSDRVSFNCAAKGSTMKLEIL